MTPGDSPRWGISCNFPDQRTSNGKLLHIKIKKLGGSPWWFFFSAWDTIKLYVKIRIRSSGEDSIIYLMSNLSRRTQIEWLWFDWWVGYEKSVLLRIRIGGIWEVIVAAYGVTEGLIWDQWLMHSKVLLMHGWGALEWSCWGTSAIRSMVIQKAIKSAADQAKVEIYFRGFLPSLWRKNFQAMRKCEIREWHPLEPENIQVGLFALWSVMLRLRVQHIWLIV